MTWYNPATWSKDIATRSATGLTSLPQTVYVQGPFGDQFAMNDYEYSGDAPAKLNRTIDNLLYGSYGRQNFINLFYCLPEIFAPVNEIASRVADATWQLKKSWNDEIDYSDKDFNRLFSQPNPLTSFKQFVYQAVCYELLTGANIEYFNRPLTLPDEYKNYLSWYNLPSDKVCIKRRQGADLYSATKMSDLVTGYEVGNRQFDTSNVLPFITGDLGNPEDVGSFRSQLCGAKLAIKNLLPVYEARGVIYIKRGALGFLVSKKSDESGLISLTKSEKEEAQREYQGSYGLTAGKNQVGVSSAPVEFVKTSMSIQELQPFDETLADAVAIYAALKVPRHLVPSKDSSTFANADADMKSFYANVIIPCANRYAEAWTNKFKFDRRYIWADFSTIPELQENRKDKATVDKTNGEIWLTRWQNGVCTLNDWIAATDGVKGSGRLYETKIFDLTDEELQKVKNVLNLKANVQNSTTPENTGTQA
jgi:hypothetical protein